jgi:uncharacterized protein YegP (UPF0339 family)
MKFEIFKSEKNEQFYFNLKAGTGQIVLSSQGYANKAGAKNGIASVQTNGNNIENFETKVASNGKHHFNLLSTNKKIIGSSQMYASKDSLNKGIQAVVTASENDTIVELTV